MENNEPTNSGTSFRKRVPRTLFFIFLLALILRIWGITFGLPGIDHGDEAEVVNHAVRFGSGDFNPHRFQYGSLVQYSLFFLYCAYFGIGYILGHFSSVHQFAVHFVEDPTLFYLIARGLSASLGAFTVVIAYLLGKRIRSDEVGLLSALFVALSYQHLIHSHYATVDGALTFFFTCAVYQCLLLCSDGRLVRYLIAGFFIGLVLATKVNGVFALVAFVTAHMVREDDTIFLKKIFAPQFWLGIGSVFIGHFIAGPYFYSNLNSALSAMENLRALHAFSGFSLWNYVKAFTQDYWGIPLGILCFAGFIRCLLTTKKKLRVLSYTAAAVLIFASLHRYVEAKYILYSLPLYAVLGSYALMEWCAPLKKRYLFLILLILLVHPVYRAVQWDYDHAQRSITLEAKEWIENHIPRNTKILLDNVGNAGPKLENAPRNVRHQYQRAVEHNLLKAEYLKLKLEITPQIYYDITQIDSSGGFREDDYRRYRLWQDTEEIGHPPDYYRDRGFAYIIVTDRYFSAMGDSFTAIKEFTRNSRGIRIYKLQ
jgi:hypothetical protein